MSVFKCSYCGKDLPSEAKFCPYCMERISEPVTVELPKDKKSLNSKSIVIIIISLILILLLLVGTAIFIHYKNTENDNNGTTEDINTVDTSGTEDTTDNNVLNSHSDKSTQEKTTDKKPDDKEENQTSNTNKESTGTTNNATTTTNDAVTECEHNWVAITEIVHHDEVGHYETVEKQKKVTKYKCPVCYEKFTGLDEYYNHFDDTHKPTYDGDPIKAFRNQYITESGYEYYETKEWIIDQKAYDENVVIGYKCSICEEEKED